MAQTVDDNYPQLVVTLQNQGRQLEQIVEYEVESDYTSSTDAFSFTAKHDDRDLLFGLEMEPVELSILGASQALGRIEITKGGPGTSRVYQGRDYLSDMVECHVDPKLKLKEGESVGSAITLAASVVGIDTIQSDDDIAMRDIRTGKSIPSQSAPKDFREVKLKEYKANPGEGVYEFCNRIAARHGCTIQPSNNRSELVLTAPNYRQEPTFQLVRRLDGQGSNIVRGEAVRDYSNFPTLLIAQGKFGAATEQRSTNTNQLDILDLVKIHFAGGALSSALTIATEALANQKAQSTSTRQKKRTSSQQTTSNSTQFSSEILETLERSAIITRTPPGTVNDPLKLYRFHYLKDEQSRTIDQLDAVSRRRFAELAKNCLTYSCTVRGHRDPVSGAIWSVDTMARVKDEVERVDELMWIHSRKLKYSGSQGATTDLQLWLPNTFDI